MSPDAAERRYAELCELEALMQPGDDTTDPLEVPERAGPVDGWSRQLSRRASRPRPRRGHREGAGDATDP